MVFRKLSSAVGVLAAALVCLTPPVANAEPAAGTTAVAAACRQHPHTAKDSFNNGYPSKGSVPVRSRGPYSDCAVDGYISDTTRLHYHCYTVNDYGNTWTWVRVVGQDIAGWVWDENLEGYGSVVPC